MDIYVVIRCGEYAVIPVHVSRSSDGANDVAGRLFNSDDNMAFTRHYESFHVFKMQMPGPLDDYSQHVISHIGTHGSEVPQ